MSLKRETAKRSELTLILGQTHLGRMLWLTASVLVVVESGCSRPTTPATKGPVQVAQQRDDSLRLAVEILQQATELPQFRAGVTQLHGPLNKHIASTNVTLDDKTRQLAKDVFRLDAAELEELEAAALRPLDAAYLQCCFLFRDAARALEVSGLPPRDQAALGFDWVMRRVLLHEEYDDSLPPHLVLMRGFGSAHDRALVALELLRQWSLDGCIIALPNKDGVETILIGVVVPKKDGANELSEVLLFDPRLGLPVAGAQGIATLADLRAHSELTKLGGISPEQLKQATARPACALPAASLRMKALENLLAGHENVVLQQDIALLQQRLAAASLPLTAWPADDVAAPRRLRRFYSPDDGGTDKSQRMLNDTRVRMPLVPVLFAFQQLRIFDDLGDDGRDMLAKLTAGVFEKYWLQPRTALLRGRHEAALKRADRINSAVEQPDVATVISEADFQREIAKWRDRVREAYAMRGQAQRDKDEAALARAENQLKQIWFEDQYLVALLQDDDAVAPQKFERKMLSHLLMRAARETLGSQSEAVKASCWHDKAARLQAQADHRQQTGNLSRGLKDDAHSAWKNARSAWAKYVDRADMSATQFRLRIEAVAALWRQGARDREFALGFADKIHLDLHQAVEAHIALAETNQRLANTQRARAELAKVHEDLLALSQLAVPRKLLQEMLDQARGQPALAFQAKRIELLLHDWTPDGHLTSLRQRVEQLQQAVK